jgi:MFS family permease
LIDPARNKKRSLFALEWLYFFLADVQTGLGPFLAAYLAANDWNPARVGYALTFGGLTAVAVQTPSGAAVDVIHRKRLLVAINLGVLVCGAFLLLGHLSTLSVCAAQFLIGPFWALPQPQSLSELPERKPSINNSAKIRPSTPQATSVPLF